MGAIALLAIPMSAASGAAFLKKRHPKLSLAIVILFFVFVIGVMTATTWLFVFLTGNYDLP